MTSLRALLAYNLKKRRKTLGISQEKLAEKVSTSTHYIGQIEQKNKFPSPEVLERITTALFSMTSFYEEALKHFQEGVQSDLETALAQAVSHTFTTRISELKKMG